jgi:hypothetical protein
MFNSAKSTARRVSAHLSTHSKRGLDFEELDEGDELDSANPLFLLPSASAPVMDSEDPHFLLPSSAVPAPDFVDHISASTVVSSPALASPSLVLNRELQQLSAFQLQTSAAASTPPSPQPGPEHDPMPSSSSPHFGLDKQPPKPLLLATMSSPLLVAQSWLAIPARATKRLTWSTPRRKMVTSCVMCVMFVILFYLVGRAVDALNIVNTTPYVSSVQISDLCLNQFGIDISMAINNPSTATATIGVMTTELRAGNASLGPNATYLVGYAYTPEFTLLPGNHTVNFSMKVEITADTAPGARVALQQWLGGAAVPFLAKIPIQAHFPPSVFIVPITFSADIEYTGLMPSYLDTSGVDNSTAEYEPVHTVQQMVLLQSADPINYVLGSLVLNVFKHQTLHATKLDVVFPPITFEAFAQGEPVGVGSSSTTYFGRALPANVPSSEFGIVRAKVALADANVHAFQTALKVFEFGPDLNMTLRAAAVSTPDIAVYSIKLGPSGNPVECWIQNLLEGVTYNYTLPYVNTSSSAANQTKLFDVFNINLASVSADGVAHAQIDAGVQGLLNFNGFHGIIPPLGVVVEIDSLNASQAPVSLILGSLPLGTPVFASQPLLSAVPFDVTLTSLSTLIESLDAYLVQNLDLVIHVHTDKHGSLTSRLLSSINFDFQLSEILGGNAKAPIIQQATPTRRRELQQGSSSFSNKTFSLAVTSDYAGFSLGLTATGFDSSTFAGVRVRFGLLTFAFKVRDPSSLYVPYQTVLTGSLGPYDSNATNPILGASLTITDQYPFPSSGYFVRQVFEQVLNGTNVTMVGSAAYAGGPSFGGSFRILLAPNASSSGSNSSGNSAGALTNLFQVYHAEIVSLQSSNLNTSLYFALDLGAVVLNVAMPPLQVGLGKCLSNTPFVTVSMSAWGFQTGGNTSEASFQISIQDSDALLGTVSDYIDGSTTRFCVKPQVASVNFLSYFIGSLGMSFALVGNNGSTGTIAAAVQVQNIVVTANATHSCTQITVSSDNSTNSSSITLGWGAIDVALSTTSAGLPYAFADIQVSKGWYGPIDAFHIAQFNAPVSSLPVVVAGCFLADSRYAVTQSAAVDQTVVQSLYDGVGFGVSISGTMVQRLGAPTVNQLSATYNLPGNLLSTFTKVSTVVGTQRLNDTLVTTSWGTLHQFELLSFNGDTFSSIVTLETGKLGFLLSLPPVTIRVAELWPDLTDTRFLEVSAVVAPFGVAEKTSTAISINVTLVRPTASWGSTLSLGTNALRGTQKVAIGASLSSASNLLSRVLPRITLNLTSSNLPAGPTTDMLNVDVRVTSPSLASASIVANLTVLSPLSAKFIWGDIAVQVYDSDPSAGSANLVGTLLLPGGAVQDVGSGPHNVNFTLFGQALALATRLWNGSDVPLGFVGSAGTGNFSSYILIDHSVLSPAAIGTGTTQAKSQLASSFTFLAATLLGGNNVGLDAVIPCLFGSLCQDLIRGDASLSYTGFTVGTKIAFTPPQISGIRYKLTLMDDVSMQVQANGFSLGTGVLRAPLFVDDHTPYALPIVSFLPIIASIPALRDTLTIYINGYDLVLTIAGTTNANFLSVLFQAINQDIEFVNLAPPDPNAPSLLNSVNIAVAFANRTRMTARLSMGVAYNPGNLTLTMDQFAGQVYFGHSQTAGAYNLDGYHVVDFGLFASPFVLAPSAAVQSVTALGSIMYQGSVGSTYQYWADEFLSRYVWAKEMPLEIHMQAKPGAPFSGSAAFNAVTYVTVPQGTATSGFIDHITVNLGSTLSSFVLSSVHITATKYMKNVLSFPIIISYFQYQIFLIDTDGVRDGYCDSANGGMINRASPCATSYYCYDPLSTATSVGPLVVSAATPPNPGVSVIAGISELPPGQVGATPLTIYGSSEMVVRLYDQDLINKFMCANIQNGMLIASVRDHNVACTDSTSTLEVDQTCTYTLRVRFNLTNYPLAGTDSCGAAMAVPFTVPFTFYSLGVYQFDADVFGVGSVMGGAGVHEIATDTTMSRSFSDNTQFSVLDSFQIYFEAYVQNTGSVSGGEGFSLNFMAQQPLSQYDPSPTKAPNSYSVVGLSNNPYGSLVVATYACNSMSFLKNGDTQNPLAFSESVAGSDADNNGVWYAIEFMYNAYDHRAQFSLIPPSGPTRMLQFDLNFRTLLHQDFAYLAFTGFGGEALYNSIYRYRNVIVSRPRTDGNQTIVEGGVSLPRAGQQGQINFRAQDEAGRKRGLGGNVWMPIVVRDAVSGAIVPITQSSSVDNHNGTYSVAYTVPVRGRYTLSIACSAGSGAGTCTNPGLYVVLTSSLFVRA